MMIDMKATLDSYEQGDMNQRLGLFLNHRFLREAFMEIDSRELEADCTKARSMKKGLAGGCKSLIKRL